MRPIRIICRPRFVPGTSRAPGWTAGSGHRLNRLRGPRSDPLIERACRRGSYCPRFPTVVSLLVSGRGSIDHCPRVTRRSI